MNRKTAKAIKTAWKTHFTKMSHDHILSVLRQFPTRWSDKDISEFFGVDTSTVKDWRSGEHKPNGANKFVFSVILAEMEG